MNLRSFGYPERVGLLACPFCREMFEEGEAKSCPVCGMKLAKFDKLPPSLDAVHDEGGVPARARARAASPGPTSVAARARSSRSASRASCSSSCPGCSSPCRTSTPSRASISRTSASAGCGRRSSAGSCSFPPSSAAATSRSCVARAWRLRFSAQFPAIAVGILLAKPPRGGIVPVRYTWDWPIYAMLAVSLIAIVVAVRLGGRADDIKVSRGTSKGQSRSLTSHWRGCARWSHAPRAWRRVVDERRTTRLLLSWHMGGARANDNDLADAERSLESIEERLDREAASTELLDVPAAVVCLVCGEVDCTGCEDRDLSRSGIVAIVAWERPAMPALTRLWATARSTTRDAESFFELLPDGPVMPALRFAAICELLASFSMLRAGLAGRGGRRARLAAPPRAPTRMRAASDPARRLPRRAGIRRRCSCSRTPCTRSPSTWARSASGARRARSRALRFGLYACGWDLVMGPLGAVVVALKEGAHRRSRRARSRERSRHARRARSSAAATASKASARRRRSRPRHRRRASPRCSASVAVIAALFALDSLVAPEARASVERSERGRPSARRRGSPRTTRPRRPSRAGRSSRPPCSASRRAPARSPSRASP